MRFHPKWDLMWVFCWASTPKHPRRDYPTSMMASSRRDLLAVVAREFGEPWRKTYRDGGRAVRCRIVPVKASHRTGSHD